MATSEKRIEANRKNALLATGPRTPEGKSIARRNALKHGLTGKGVVLPADEEKDVAARRARLAEALKPEGDEENELLDHMALARHRVERAASLEFTRRAEAAARARTCWAEDRRLAAEELALKLPRRPALVARQLRRTLQGCELLLDRWRGLLRVAESGTAWDDSGRSRALDLLGVPVEDREHHPFVHAKATAGDLAAVAREEIEHLEARRDGYLEDDDESDRVLAETGLAFDDSPTGRRLWSYERANDRIFARGLVELERRRRARGIVPSAARPRREASQTAAAAKVPSISLPARDPGPTALPPLPPVAAVAAASVAFSPPPATSPPPQPAGNRRQRRAQLALARRRG